MVLAVTFDAWLDLARAHLVAALSLLAGHPLALLLGWQALSALTTWLTRARSADERERFKLASPYLYAFVVFCEGAGVDLPKLVAWLGQGVRLALDLQRGGVDKPPPPP